ncbi:MAG TPA: nucleoside triphosphate pyrophosphohydrolase [Candidatus Latescibacteria bacterium]|nr:nucleoside triphosphate pyrophosphohydrolase [Candidatus Latescibacterota bacterium]
MTPLEELIEVMARLRAPGGCPWDREQTHESLIPYLVEETYEAVEAIEHKDFDELKKELGDVLLQVIFHARLAEEAGRWNIHDVAAATVAKLKHRHPHVFGNVSADTPEQVLANWEQIKQRERAGSEKESVLDGVPSHLPALRKAKRVQEKVARVGFDWERTEQVVEKVEEEFQEFREACRKKDRVKTEEELGDVLFALVNLARFLDTDPEDSLRKTVDKFTRRFKYIEAGLAARGKLPQDASLAEMDALWDEAKSLEHTQQPKE